MRGRSPWSLPLHDPNPRPVRGLRRPKPPPSPGIEIRRFARVTGSLRDCGFARGRGRGAGLAAAPARCWRPRRERGARGGRATNGVTPARARYAWQAAGPLGVAARGLRAGCCGGGVADGPAAGLRPVGRRGQKGCRRAPAGPARGPAWPVRRRGALKLTASGRGRGGGRGRAPPPGAAAAYEVAHFWARRVASHGSLHLQAGYLQGPDLQRVFSGGVQGQPLQASYIWLSFHLPQIMEPATV
jgi:hypothetical protein